MKVYDNGTREWHHKDGSRMYWGVRAAKWENDNDGEEVCIVWRYEVLYGSSSPSEVIYTGFVTLQEGIVPDPEDFFADYQQVITQALIGFSKYPEQWYG